MEVAFDERQQTCEQRVADDAGFLQGRSVIHGLLDEFRDFGPETFRTPLFQGVLLVDETLQADGDVGNLCRLRPRLRACESFIFKKTFLPRRRYYTSDSLRVG